MRVRDLSSVVPPVFTCPNIPSPFSSTAPGLSLGATPPMVPMVWSGPTCWLQSWYQLSESVGATCMIPQTGGLNSRNGFSRSSRGWKSIIKVQPGPASGEGSPPGPRMVTSSLSSQGLSLVCAQGEISLPFLIRTPVLWDLGSFS